MVVRNSEGEYDISVVVKSSSMTWRVKKYTNVEELHVNVVVKERKDH